MPLCCRAETRLARIGKTTVAVALCYLFGFGHVQSDDIKQKKAAPVFLKNVASALKEHDVVIADKYALPPRPSPPPR